MSDAAIGEYFATPPTLTDREQRKLRLDATGALVVAGGSGGGDASAANQSAIQAAAGSDAAKAVAVQGVTGGKAVPVSAASLPLPTGAATAAKQPALGTSGTPSADVITVQGPTVAGNTVASIAPVLAGMVTGSTVLPLAGNTQYDLYVTPRFNGIAMAGVNGIYMQGIVASGATDAGNPLKIGGLYTAGNQPAFSSGQRGNVNIDARGNLRVGPVYTMTTAADAFSNTLIGFAFRDASDVQSIMPATAGYCFNGTGWDRLKKPNLIGRLISAAASTNATSVKTSAGDVFMIMLTNTTASIKYLKLYNKASAPTVGTDTPVATFAIPASTTNHQIDLGANGQYFGTGIAFALTGAAADADATALAAGDITCLNLTYSG